MRLGLLMFVACLLGCGGGHGGGSGGGDVQVLADAGSGGCMDEDGDGFGYGCVPGADCDDADPNITDECRRCAVPNKGCPCEVGSKPLNCDPDDKRVTMNGVTGTLVCSEGTRYCRDGIYSDCEILFQYATFVPDK